MELRRSSTKNPRRNPRRSLQPYEDVSLPVIDVDLGNVANDFGEKLIGDISTAGTESGYPQIPNFERQNCRPPDPLALCIPAHS